MADEEDLGSKGKSAIGGGNDKHDPPTKDCGPTVSTHHRTMRRRAKQRMTNGAAKEGRTQIITVRQM